MSVMSWRRWKDRQDLLDKLSLEAATAFFSEMAHEPTLAAEAPSRASQRPSWPYHSGCELESCALAQAEALRAAARQLAVDRARWSVFNLQA